jgi:hypothetical protein
MRYIHTGTNILKTAYLTVAVAFVDEGNATAMAAPTPLSGD